VLTVVQDRHAPDVRRSVPYRNPATRRTMKPAIACGKRDLTDRPEVSSRPVVLRPVQGEPSDGLQGASLSRKSGKREKFHMKIQAILTPKPGTPLVDFEPHVVAEERAVWHSYESGSLREMFFQPAPLTVVLVFEAPDDAAVHTALADYPMVAAGLFDVTLITLGPWLPIKALFRADALG